MVTKTCKFRALNLNLDELIELAQIFESNTKKNRSRVVLALGFGDSEIYHLDNSEELKNVLKHELTHLKEIDFAVYSDTLVIKLDQAYSSADYVLEVTATSKDRVLLVQEAVKTLLTKRKNPNWLVRSPSAHTIVATLALFVFAASVRSLFSYQVLEGNIIDFVGIGILAVLMTVVGVSWLLRRKYPLLLINHQSDANGRNASKDWYWFVAAVVLPIAEGIIVSRLT